MVVESLLLTYVCGTFRSLTTTTTGDGARHIVSPQSIPVCHGFPALQSYCVEPAFVDSVPITAAAQQAGDALAGAQSSEGSNRAVGVQPPTTTESMSRGVGTYMLGEAQETQDTGSGSQRSLPEWCVRHRPRCTTLPCACTPWRAGDWGAWCCAFVVTCQRGEQVLRGALFAQRQSKDQQMTQRSPSKKQSSKAASSKRHRGVVLESWRGGRGDAGGKRGRLAMRRVVRGWRVIGNR